jgi:Flp pilus assembly protein TadG
MPAHYLSSVRRAGRKLRGLWSCDRGSVAPLVGVAMITLVGAVGVAVDVGRGQVAQSKLQASLDSAGLAAGAMVGQTLDSDDLKPEASKYLHANFNGTTVDATISGFDLELSEDNSVVTLSATATLPTTFMRIFGETMMQVSARSEITRETKGLEVALVVDVTGSMGQAVGGTPYDSTKKIDALKSSATDLINILFGSNTTVDDLFVGIVPFSQSVNVGTNRTGWSSDYATRAAKDNCIGTTSTSSTPHCPTTGNNGRVTMASIDSPTRPSISTRTNPVTLVDDWMVGPTGNSLPSTYKYTHAWGGCFEERYASGDDVTDETPDNEPFKVYFYPDQKEYTTDADNDTTGGNNWINNGTGAKQVASGSDRWANKSCPLSPVTPMTNTKATLTTAITNLASNGNTVLPTGMVWGWRMLSPKWRGVWGGTMDAHSLPLDYHEQLSQKAVIFMTDGKNEIDTRYGPFGPLAAGNMGTTDEATANTVKLREKTLAICNSLKENGVLVYTITFGAGSDPATKTMLKTCASEEDFFFDSPSKEALKAAFRAIGDSLSKLRVSK